MTEYYNKDKTIEETKKWRVKNEPRIRQAESTATDSESANKETEGTIDSIAQPGTTPPPNLNIHLPSWRLLRTELLRRLVREGTLRPYYLELRHLPNLFQAALTDPMKETKILSYAIMSTGRLAAPVTKSTAACELLAVKKLKLFYDDFIIPLDCAKVIIGAPNYG